MTAHPGQQPRERAVPCLRCLRLTMATMAVCERCAPPTIPREG